MQVYASSLDCRGTNQLQTSLRLGDQYEQLGAAMTSAP